MNQPKHQANPSNNLNSAPTSHDIDAWLAYLESLHPKNIEMGLERMNAVYQQMALPKLAKTVITVAGTNGKGSTCAYIEHCLREAGYRVGVYSSPHLIRFNERVRINGAELSDQHHIAAFKQVDTHRQQSQLTFFEFSTLAAFYLFSQAQLDVLILEVGLGGRLDATNIIDTDVAVVTTVAHDHEAFLGNDIEQIGREKAGIFRADTPAILGDSQLPQSVADYARHIGANDVKVEQDFFLERDAEGFCYRSAHNQWNGLAPQFLPIENLATALAAIEHSGLSIELDAIRRGVAKAALSGRWQQWRASPDIRLDVAHNPQATAWLANKLRHCDHSGRTIALVAMLEDKDSMNALANVIDVVDEWHVASLPPPRGADASQLLPYLPEGTPCYDDVASAYRSITSQLAKEDLLIVFGSFYTVAAVLTA